ncbi:basic leucine zipper 61-like [Juglans microcarpa x Juglans regia]|uniref:basic leucine zipper 61-like n=1 Tax=Juglans microcarpa x Juglans regia TaxID=2249226 RepID=UPI001B7F3B2E|nr:basic leucine zipper 61-like [Juglans microcarpa x Juglans regia]
MQGVNDEDGISCGRSNMLNSSYGTKAAPFSHGSCSYDKRVAPVGADQPKNKMQHVPPLPPIHPPAAPATASQSLRDRDAKITDPKKLKRVLASRQYSQKYRLKQLQYMMELETEVKALQAEVAINGPRIRYADRQNTLLRVENNSMKQKLSNFSTELMFKEAEFEELANERDMLKQLFESYQKHQQLPDLFRSSSGNYQFPNMGLNQVPEETDDDFLRNGMPQMMNQNLNLNENQNQNSNLLGNAEFTEYMNSLSLDPSYNFL